MRLLCVFLLSLMIGFGAADNASARSSSSHSSKSSSSHKTKSKSDSHYIIRHCKTEACLKKHPSGSYGFTPGEHKRKN